MIQATECNEPTRLLRFTTRDNTRLTIRGEVIESLLELNEECCQIVTNGDTYCIIADFVAAEQQIWPADEMVEMTVQSYPPAIIPHDRTGLRPPADED